MESSASVDCLSRAPPFSCCGQQMLFLCSENSQYVHKLFIFLGRFFTPIAQFLSKLTRRKSSRQHCSQDYLDGGRLAGLARPLWKRRAGLPAATTGKQGWRWHTNSNSPGGSTPTIRLGQTRWISLEAPSSNSAGVCHSYCGTLRGSSKTSSLALGSGRGRPLELHGRQQSSSYKSNTITLLTGLQTKLPQSSPMVSAVHRPGKG